jgi:FlaA1/EpsC-like NDP-sugar epimerase
MTVYNKSFLDFKHLKKTMSKIKFLPRWLVLVLDVMILLFSVISTEVLLLEFDRSFVKNENLQEIIWLGVISTNVFFFVVIKTYVGIIRHSSFIDGIKILLTQTITCSALAFLNWYYASQSGSTLFLPIGLVIYFSFSFIYLFLYRIFVKYLFDFFLNIHPNNRINAVIYGCDANAIAVVNALITETPARFKIIGFIDPYHANHSKRILNIPIYSRPKRISVLMRSLKSNAIIFADNNINKQQKIQIIDDCLEFNFKVYISPMVSDWENNNEISKKIKKFEIQDLLDRKEIVLDKKSISNQIKNKVILVTGAAGSIGSEISRQILNFYPKKLLLLDQAESPLHDLMLEIKKSNPTIKVVPIIADIRNKNLLESIFELYQPQIIYHAAAYKHVPLMEDNPNQAVFTNVLGTKILADLSCNYQIESFVLVSTDKAVNPTNVMGASKRIAECYIHYLHQNSNILNHNTKFISTRFGNVLGSNGSVVSIFSKQIEQGGPVTITHPDIIRYFMTIPEACQLVLEAGSMGKGGEVFIFDMGEPVKIIELAKKMILLAGLTPYKDIDIQSVGLRPGEKLFEELLTNHSKTLPTYHQKILIALDVQMNSKNLAEELEVLFTLAKNNDEYAIVKKMKEIVPEYISNNSKFQNLDTLN